MNEYSKTAHQLLISFSLATLGPSEQAGSTKLDDLYSHVDFIIHLSALLLFSICTFILWFLNIF